VAAASQKPSWVARTGGQREPSGYLRISCASPYVRCRNRRSVVLGGTRLHEQHQLFGIAGHEDGLEARLFPADDDNAALW